MSFKVRIVQAERSIEVPTGATILGAALDAGISYPFGCQSDACSIARSWAWATPRTTSSASG
jgi:ferredoxin-NAD(P)+ reductase (naphthalene dioxygenase ferredoxin-specific)